MKTIFFSGDRRARSSSASTFADRGAADPNERRGDRDERPAVGLTVAVPRAGPQSGRPAAGLHLQERHPPAIRRRRGGVHVPNDAGEGGQDVLFLRGGPDDVRGGDAFGQLEIDVRARVADHYFAQKLTEPIAPAGLRQRVDLAVLPAELRLALQETRPQQLDQVVQFGHVVADGCRAQEQEKALLQIVHELPARAGAVLGNVGFVDDHEVVLDARQPIAIRRLTRERQRRDHKWLARPELLVPPDQLGVGGHGPQRAKRPISSSTHCPTSEAGVKISAFRARLRIQYSFNVRHASIVLPRPTSSASSTRPRKSRSTRRTVSSR